MHYRLITALAAVASLSIVLVACGSDTSTAKPNDDGVVEITMKDSRFVPNRIEVEAGERVMFRFTNDGALVHEAFIGTMAEQQAHANDVGMGHGSMSTPKTSTPDPDMGELMVTVDPGKRSELTYTAADAGTVLIGCHQPGHWDAGMRATVDVA
jgi:uncharacterized cupredoxin-like copper-binding protein